jgi:hypothetical protein
MRCLGPWVQFEQYIRVGVVGAGIVVIDALNVTCMQVVRVYSELVVQCDYVARLSPLNGRLCSEGPARQLLPFRRVPFSQESHRR